MNAHDVQGEYAWTDAVTVLLGRFGKIVARGLAGVLGDDPRIHVLASDLDADALVAEAGRRKPRVAVLHEDHEQSLRERLRAVSADVGIIVLANDPVRAYGMLLMADGASCIASNVSDLGDIVARVSSGERIFVSSSGAVVGRRYPRDAPLLTRRELDVLRYASQAAPYAQIALALGIAPETVRRHVASICRKLGVRHKRELVGMPVPGHHAHLA